MSGYRSLGEALGSEYCGTNEKTKLGHAGPSRHKDYAAWDKKLGRILREMGVPLFDLIPKDRWSEFLRRLEAE